jgi:glycosyltransferase-like protein LARGE
MSLERLHMLELIAGSWSGPISLALYTSDADSARFLAFYTGSAILAGRCNIGVHLVYAEGEFFPINHLRNVALRQVRQTYFSRLAVLRIRDIYPGLKIFYPVSRIEQNRVRIDSPLNISADVIACV